MSRVPYLPIAVRIRPSLRVQTALAARKSIWFDATFVI